MYFGFSVRLILVVDFCLHQSFATRYFISQIGDFLESFNEIILKNGTHIGGVGRLKAAVDECEHCLLLHMGNTLRATTDKHVDKRLDHALTVLNKMNVLIYVLSKNDFLFSRSAVYERLAAEYTGRMPILNVDITPKLKPVFFEDLTFLGYISEDVKNLRGAAEAKIDSIVNFLETQAEYLITKSKRKIIIAVGCSGLNLATSIAKETTKINVVISGCSRHLFWNENISPENIDVQGKYPLTVRNKAGLTVIVAHFYGSTRFIGTLELDLFDEKISGVAGRMQYMYSEMPQNWEIMDLVHDFENNTSTAVIGKTSVLLNGHCQKSECNLGNLIADAFVEYKASIYTGNHWTDTPIGLVPSVMIKSSINVTAAGGVITQKDVIDALLDNDKLVTVEIKGAHIRRLLEEALAFSTVQSKFLQVSGLRILYSSKKKPGERLVSVKVRCDKCDVPSYSVLKRPQQYYLVTTQKVARGAYGHSVLQNKGNIVKVENTTINNAIYEHIKKFNTIYTSNSDRIIEQATFSSAKSFNYLDGAILTARILICTLMHLYV